MAYMISNLIGTSLYFAFIIPILFLSPVTIVTVDIL